MVLARPDSFWMTMLHSFIYPDLDCYLLHLALIICLNQQVLIIVAIEWYFLIIFQKMLLYCFSSSSQGA